MRIAIVNKFFFLQGGQETVALEHLRLLQEAGHEVAFFAMHHPKNPPDYYWSKYFVDHADFSMRDVAYTGLEKLKMSLRFIDNPQAAHRFTMFLDEFKPDVIHCHGIAHQLTYSILRQAKMRGIPIVQTLHDFQIICPSYTLLKGGSSICQSGCSSGNYLPCITHRCVKQSHAASVLSAAEMFYNRTLRDYTTLVDVFVSPSVFLANCVIATGIPRHKIQVIPNFLVGLETIIPSAQHHGYFLYLGRLAPEKGLMTLLKAFEQVPQAQLRIAGDGSLSTELQAFCSAKGLRNVTFLRHVPRDQIPELISNSVSVVLPSEWYENQPMCIIEAFAYGKPVIGSNIGGIAEMICDGETGRLVPPGDVDALAQVIRDFQKQPIVQMAKCTRQRALNLYTGTQHLASLLQLYKSLYPPTTESLMQKDTIRYDLDRHSKTHS